MPKQKWNFVKKDDKLIVWCGDNEPVEIQTSNNYIRDIETSKPLEQQRMLRAVYELNTNT